jgi:Mn2+/Fe2+ NRAMP family transporter
MSGLVGNILGLVQSVSNIGDTLASGVDARLRNLRDAVREETRRLSTSLALSILAATCSFAALTFGAIAILIATRDTHPVLAASLIAAGFALVALLAVLLIRGNSR